MKPPNAIELALAGLSIIVLAFLFSGHIPRGDPGVEVRIAKDSLKSALRLEIEAKRELADRDRELEHTRTVVVHDTVALRGPKLAYDYGKTHLDTTSTDSLKAQLQRADTVIVGQTRTIADYQAEVMAFVAKNAARDSVDDAKDARIRALERLNAGVEAQIPTLRQKIVHDAKVAGYTAAGIGLAKMILSATGH